MCDRCPTRKPSAPVRDFIKALELRIEEARSEDVCEQNKANDDNAERSDGPGSDSMERFDDQMS